MTNLNVSDGYAFCGFELSPARRALTCARERVAIAPKELDLLTLLVSCAGRVVTKDEIVYRVWPSEAVTDANLAQLVHRLRMTLASCDPKREFIATIPGQGYQFVQSVDRAGVGAAVSPQAFQLYRRGAYYLAQRTGDGLRKSIDLFQDALALEPRYASALVGVAQANAFLGEYLFCDPFVAFPEAKRAAQEALETDPNCAEAHAVMGEVLLFFENDWEGAASAYRTALSLAPYSVTARLLSAWHAIFSAKSADAIEELQRALTIDPASVLLNSTLGVALYYGGNKAEAAQQLQEALLFDEDSPLARYYYALVLADEGEYEGALGFLEGIVEAAYELQATALMGYIFARMGSEEAARDALARVVRPRDRRPSYYSAALIAIGLGDKAGALDQLERAYRAHEPPVILAAIHPIYTSALAGEPRFAQLVRAMHRQRLGAVRTNGRS